MTSFGQGYLEPFELLAVGIGNVNELNFKQSVKFCNWIGLKYDQNDDEIILHQKINRYMLHLKPEDFVNNLEKLPYPKQLIVDVLDANLKSANVELENFQKVLHDIKLFISTIQNPNPEQRLILNEVVASLKD